MFDEAGEITHVVIAFIDISREVQAEVARAEAEARTLRAERLEAVGQLAGGIAHDFNNLLAAVRLVAGSLRQGEDDPARLEALGQIESAAETGTELTRSLLSFAQRRTHAPVPLSVNEVATDVMKLLRLPIDPRLELGADLHASGHVSADRSQIDQVLMNLVVNAREAAGSSGVVVVHTRDAVLAAAEAARRGLAPGPYVVIEVRDDGPGIDAGVRDRIFEPYFTTKSPTEHGRGLGLATVFGIVTSHGGVVESASNTPRGTVMRVFLPSVTASAESGPRSSVRAPMTRGRGTVLVVDDEPLVRKATSAALRHLGYDVLGACDGDEGVAMFRENRAAIRLVVLDMVMPRMDGQETLRLLRGIDPGVRVLLTTGNTPEDGEGLELGVAGLITKPYGLEELSEAIANAMA
jgi:nitrogen-specific signal transduction histidine kinase/CheY-like chemotaxis protein